MHIIRWIGIALGLYLATLPIANAGEPPESAKSPPLNAIGVRIFSYGEFQETAWEHLPSLGIRYIFLAVPPPEEVAALKEKLEKFHLQAVVLRGEAEFSRSEAVEALAPQLESCKKLGARYLFLSVKHPAIDKPTVHGWLRKAGDIARKHDVTIVLETHPDLGTNADVQLETMQAVNHPNVRVNFDTGNISYYNSGRDAVTELRKILPYVATVEIKDHNGQLETWNFPPLGRGKVDIRGVIQLLRKQGFHGPITLEIEGVSGLKKSLAQTKRDIADSVAFIRSLGKFD